MDDDTLLADMRAWIEKAVIGLDLCPFARSAYVEQRVRFVVSDAPHADAFLEQLDRELEFLAAADPADIETTLLIHPTLFADFEVFNDIAGIAEEAVVEHGLEGVVQVASFHPRFRFADTEPDDISNYTNRAPWPTLHLLREASITRVLEHVADPDAIYERNIATLEKLGHDGWRDLGLRDAAHEPDPSS